MPIELELDATSALRKIWEMLYPGTECGSPTETYEQVKTILESKDAEIRLLAVDARELDNLRTELEQLRAKRKRKEKAAV